MKIEIFDFFVDAYNPTAAEHIDKIIAECKEAKLPLFINRQTDDLDITRYHLQGSTKVYLLFLQPEGHDPSNEKYHYSLEHFQE
jgi:hypothetical protein